MTSTGIVKNLDEMGRIVIPVEMRREFAVDVGTSVEFLVDTQTGEIGMRRQQTGCTFCGNVDDLVRVGPRQVPVCGSCCRDAARYLSRRAAVAG